MPVSKSKTRDYLEKNLNKNYSLTALYREMKMTILKDYQGKIEEILWNYLQKQKKLSLFFFLMLPLCTLKHLKKMISENLDFLKIINPINHNI
ncbi:hypothetical protein COY88_01720 [Candidatus Roizmanbacteria bacterium CG_4_10_14_0_8_um_filter_35_28]|uniref:Uncharacterized protein n=1 Tax=Candidatus Roizmanbacteria bacterium CG_4_10_14_0_8_um_filter_35_28 TaxID=1974827 RepID=A0A2M7QFU2_9BACT|nr:MAG: hypothetical protein COY88_01720 [Candidatus Roizmanbacteria bacterium CG_4_10_14_0_8_um_filter_35_28]